MNTNKLTNNCLLIATSNKQTEQDVLRVAFRLAKDGKKVLYIAAKAPQSIPSDDYDEVVCRDILQNLTFSYSANATELENFFIDMYQFQPRPEVIIVNFLHTFFDEIHSLDTDNTCHANFIENHMFITAAFHAAIDMLSQESNKVTSIVCLDINQHDIYKRFIQTYIDLYYYKADTILSSNDLSRFKIQQIQNAMFLMLGK